MSRNKTAINKFTKKGTSIFTCNLSSNFFQDILFKLTIQQHRMQPRQ